MILFSSGEKVFFRMSITIGKCSVNPWKMTVGSRRSLSLIAFEPEAPSVREWWLGLPAPLQKRNSGRAGKWVWGYLIAVTGSAGHTDHKHRQSPVKHAAGVSWPPLSLQTLTWCPRPCSACFTLLPFMWPPAGLQVMRLQTLGAGIFQLSRASAVKTLIHSLVHCLEYTHYFIV